MPEPVRAQTVAAWGVLPQQVLDHYESLLPPTHSSRRRHNLTLAL